MDASVSNAKRIIKKQVKKGEYSNNNVYMFKYYKVYPVPTENTKESLKHIDFKDINKVLTGTEGLTHPFDMVAKGAKTVDVFDYNAMTEYHILGYLIALIEKYNYEEFMIVHQKILDPNTSLQDLTQILFDLLPYMDKKYRMHWSKLIDYNYDLQFNSENPLNLVRMLSYHYENTMANVSVFLENEDAYNKFKENLRRAKITFTRANPLELRKKFSGEEYDLIYLASSLDHLSCYGIYNYSSEFVNEYFKDLQNITSDLGGVIAANAINTNALRVWRNSRVQLEELEKLELSIHKIPNAFDKAHEDLLILNRKIGY